MTAIRFTIFIPPPPLYPKQYDGNEYRHEKRDLETSI